MTRPLLAYLALAALVFCAVSLHRIANAQVRQAVALERGVDLDRREEVVSLRERVADMDAKLLRANTIIGMVDSTGREALAERIAAEKRAGVKGRVDRVMGK